MKLSSKIARRYLFSKKSTNAINLITGISVMGMALGTTALILVLSVFNGLEDLLTGLYNDFNPDLKITIREGKTFSPDTFQLKQLRQLAGVDLVSEVLEEVALFEYEKSEAFGIIKGVDDDYQNVTRLDSVLWEGEYALRDGERNLMIAGIGMRNKLSMDISDPFAAITVFMVKRKKSKGLSDPFKRRLAFPAATFLVQHQEMDESYMLTNLEFVRELLAYETEVSALEIKLNPNVSIDESQIAIQQIMGPDFEVKNRHQQSASYFKIMNMEKWMGFAILCLMLILIAFNIVGALWMIVIDKKKDIAILRSLGASPQLIRNIFLKEGVLISSLGLFIGFSIALLIYSLQKYKGVIEIPANTIVNAYPISAHFSDFLATAIAVFAIGFLAALPAASQAARFPVFIKED